MFELATFKWDTDFKNVQTRVRKQIGTKKKNIHRTFRKEKDKNLYFPEIKKILWEKNIVQKCNQEDQRLHDAYI